MILHTSHILFLTNLNSANPKFIIKLKRNDFLIFQLTKTAGLLNFSVFAFNV